MVVEQSDKKQSDLETIDKVIAKLQMFKQSLIDNEHRCIIAVNIEDELHIQPNEFRSLMINIDYEYQFPKIS